MIYTILALLVLLVIIVLFVKGLVLAFRLLVILLLMGALAYAASRYLL